jgi:glucose/arabinose dehydrogenase
MTQRLTRVLLSLLVVLLIGSMPGAQSSLQKYRITPQDLPAPFATPDAPNPSTVVPRPADAVLMTPVGFSVSVFAEGDFKRVRWVAQALNGDVFATDAVANTLVLLRDRDGDGAAEERHVFAEGLNRPFGIAFSPNGLYVANVNAVLRWKYAAGQIKAEGEPEKMADLPDKGSHWTRNLQFSRDGRKLYVSVGSESDAGPSVEERAAILEMNPDGTGRRVLATGMRNPIGMAIRPESTELWAAVQERDKVGDELVPDYVARVKDGAFYGWPFAYAGANVDPRHKGEEPDLVKRSLAGDVLVQAHSAIMGLAFYDGTMFPREYRGDAFAALRGSSNRSKRTGYKVIRIPFSNGRPTGGYEDFVTGWMLGEDRKEVWGRPVGLAVLKDGSMLVADDAGNRIWRIAYRGTGDKK